MKKILFLFTVFILLMLTPMVSAVEYKTSIETNRNQLRQKILDIIKENTDDPLILKLISIAIWFVFDVTVLSCIIRVITGNSFSQIIKTASALMVIYLLLHCFVLPWIIAGYRSRQ